MTTVTATGYACYEDLPRAARDLCDDFVTTNPFMCGDWLGEFEARLLKSNEQPYYVVVTGANGPQLIVPLIVETVPWLRVRKVRSMANFYTNIYAPVSASGILADGDIETIVDALVDCIVDAYPRAPLVEISPLRGESPLYTALIGSFNARGYRTRRFGKTANWHEPFTDRPDYDDYLARRPGKLRSTLKRKTRVLARETSSRFEVTGPGGDFDTALDDFQRVYADSWKPEESCPEFIRVMVSKLMAADRARTGVLYVDDEPAAAQIWLRIGNHWGVFKLSYRPQFAKYSVGSLLTARMIEEFLKLPDTRCIDFLSGDDGYKADWVSVKGEHWGFEAINLDSPWGKLLSFKRRLSNTGVDDST